MIKYKYLFSLLLLFISTPYFTLAQWESLGDSIIPKNHRVSSLKIASDQSIWLVSTHHGRIPEEMPEIRRSTNAGNTWTTSKILLDAPSSVADISPIDSMNAFITLGRAGLYKTANGGQDWIKVESYPYSCSFVHFFNKDEGWVSSGLPNFSLENDKKWILQSVTKDGGETWTHIGGETWNQPNGTSLPNQDSSELIRNNYLTSSSYDCSGNSIILGMSSGKFWISKDKGFNWSSHETPLATLGLFTANVAMKDTNIFMVAGNYSASGAGTNTLNYTTLDGGKTWLEGNPEVTATTTHYIPKSDSIFIMVGQNDYQWGGGKGTVITYDYGANWNYLSNSRLIAIDFLDSNFGYAACCNTAAWSNTTGQVFQWNFDFPTIPDKSFNWLLWTMVSLSLIVLGGILHRNRIHSVTNEAQASLQMSALEKSALLAQMNPHFIFNALNSLQSFINNNETEKSNIFLSHFSQLIRCTLQSTAENEISLESEIELLKSYLELEKMRFKNRFDYRISVDENIDLLDTRIPSMITQPFVENAIIHGLSKNNKKGMIELDYKISGNYLVITVKDNGKGIYHTQKTKAKLHKSVGMSNTLKRLKLINPENEMTVEELKEDNGNINGTKITLNILINSKSES